MQRIFSDDDEQLTISILLSVEKKETTTAKKRIRLETLKIETGPKQNTLISSLLFILSPNSH